MSDNDTDIVIVAPPPNARATLAGAVTERTTFDPLLDPQMRTLDLDLAQLRRINSYGVRGWIETLAKLEAAGVSVTLSRCPPAFVRQLAVIPSVRANARVVSLLLPLVCTACGREATVERADANPPPCAACGGACEIDDDLVAFEGAARLISSAGGDRV